MPETIILVLAGVTALAIGCQWLAWFLKLPAILFLLLAGIILGPVTGLFDPDPVFEDLLFPFVSLSVALILFEGSLTLRFHEIAESGRVIRRLLTGGLATTWVIIAVATRYLLDASWDLSFLFGALVVVTGPTVIVPMLRTVRPNAKIANLLRWEGILIDPLGAILAVLVYDFIITEAAGDPFIHTALSFGSIILVGAALGMGAAQIHGELLRRFWLPEYLHNVATLAAVMSVYAASDYLADESGLLAVTIMGVRLANMRAVPIEKILDFKESLSLLLISILFVLLAARIDFDDITALGWGAVGVLAVIQFIARPLKILVATWGSSFTWQERALLSWIAPRGIVAAAISSLFAFRLEELNYPFAPLLPPLTFIVIIGTVLLQSLTAGWLARRLGVADPEPRGFLVVGANLVARTIAGALKEAGFRVTVADTNWENISKARMEGLSFYFGNPVSAHADRRLDLVGIGRLLALSPQGEQNALATLRYRPEFGRDAVYAIQTAVEKQKGEKHIVSAEHKGFTLFGEEITFSTLASSIAKGAEVKSTKLSEEFTMEAYRLKYGSRALPLFTINPKGKIGFFVTGGAMAPGPGWTVTSLVESDDSSP